VAGCGRAASQTRQRSSTIANSLIAVAMIEGRSEGACRAEADCAGLDRGQVVCLQVCARFGSCFLAGQQCGGLSSVRWWHQPGARKCRLACARGNIKVKMRWNARNEWRRGVAFSVEQIERHQLQRELPT
jgi:hypothetical protein